MSWGGLRAHTETRCPKIGLSRDERPSQMAEKRSVRQRRRDRFADAAPLPCVTWYVQNCLVAKVEA